MVDYTRKLWQLSALGLRSIIHCSLTSGQQASQLLYLVLIQQPSIGTPQVESARPSLAKPTVLSLVAKVVVNMAHTGFQYHPPNDNNYLTKSITDDNRQLRALLRESFEISSQVFLQICSPSLQLYDLIILLPQRETFHPFFVPTHRNSRISGAARSVTTSASWGQTNLS